MLLCAMGAGFIALGSAKLWDFQFPLRDVDDSNHVLSFDLGPILMLIYTYSFCFEISLKKNMHMQINT